jgi:hypothetical protein
VGVKAAMVTLKVFLAMQDEKRKTWDGGKDERD